MGYMAIARRLLTNFSKGELSPLIEGRPDLAAYFEGGRTIKNFDLLRQGGVRRRFGSRFVAEVKDSTKDTIILPFEADVDTTRIIEVGNSYERFYKSKQQLKTSAGGPAVEISGPYTEAQIRNIHFTQSVDVMYWFHPDVAQRKLSRVSDTSWALTQPTFDPPPSLEDDTDVSGTATLTPSDVIGNDITFTMSQAKLLPADVGRLVVSGAARALIKGLPSAGSLTFTADILDPFPDTNPIAAGAWKLRLSPQTTLDPNKKGPEGAQVTLVAGASAFRTADVGKFIVIYGGLVRVDIRDSATQVRGEILSEMGATTASDPAAAPAGAWTLEVASWSATNGFPRTGEFVQGRLAQAGTNKQRTTFWMSQSEDFENYATGVAADNAIDYTIASRQLNRIEWLADNVDMFVGTSGAELRVTSGGSDEPLGGNKVPFVSRHTANGSAPIQPLVINRRIMFVDRSQKKIFVIAFNFEEDGFEAIEITGASEHITGPTGLKLGAIAFARRPDPRLFFIRADGQLVTLTYFLKEKVVGFTRYVTDGTFESVAVIPQTAGKADQVWVIVKRTINSVVKRYVEVLDEDASELGGRLWTSLQTDCAKVYNLAGVPTTSLTELSHLEGKTVDVVADDSFRGTKVVTAGVVTLDESASKYVEVGLHYDSELQTMRPAVENQMVEGLPRSWIKLWVRLFETIGGKLNNERLQYPPAPLNKTALFTGDRDVTAYGVNPEGYVTMLQDQPYPMTVLAVFGEIEFGDHG